MREGRDGERGQSIDTIGDYSNHLMRGVWRELWDVTRVNKKKSEYDNHLPTVLSTTGYIKQEGETPTRKAKVWVVYIRCLEGGGGGKGV